MTDDLFKLGIKCFAADTGRVDIRNFIPVFHSWIQEQKIPGHLLIDVHDYSHVQNGPGILLVAHEGNFSTDQDEGRLGLEYYRKQPISGDGLKMVFEIVTGAARLLEADARLNGVKFISDEFLVFSNDRLHAPNSPDTRKRFESAIKHSFPDSTVTLAPRSADPRERRAFVVTPVESVAVTLLTAHRQHPRRCEDFKFVYPVLSRRSHGISIGINTNPDKVCNFDCIYCQVDRTTESPIRKFDLAGSEEELRAMIDIVQSGDIAKCAPFDSVPADLLHLHDIALSGDAEPTTLPSFSATIAMIANVKPKGTKIVLITDAAGLDRPDVKRGLETMDANDGEVWAKLDAGTEQYFKEVNRTSVPFAKILKNIQDCAATRPVVIQTLFMNIRGVGLSGDEIAGYCDRLREIHGANPPHNGIKLVQIYTIARKPMTVVNGVPAWQFVTALSNAELDSITARVRQETGLDVEAFYGN